MVMMRAKYLGAEKEAKYWYVISLIRKAGIP
jgi:hypothetical protein